MKLGLRDFQRWVNRPKAKSAVVNKTPAPHVRTKICCSKVYETPKCHLRPVRFRFGSHFYWGNQRVFRVHLCRAAHSRVRSPGARATPVPTGNTPERTSKYVVHVAVLPMPSFIYSYIYIYIYIYIHTYICKYINISIDTVSQYIGVYHGKCLVPPQMRPPQKIRRQKGCNKQWRLISPYYQVINQLSTAY